MVMKTMPFLLAPVLLAFLCVSTRVIANDSTTVASRNNSELQKLGLRVATCINIGRHFQDLLIETEYLYDFRDSCLPVRSVGIGLGVGFSTIGPSIIPVSLSACFGRRYCFELNLSGLYAYNLRSNGKTTDFINWPASRTYVSWYSGFLYLPYDSGVLYGVGVGIMDDLNTEFASIEFGIKVGYVF